LRFILFSHLRRFTRYSCQKCALQFANGITVITMAPADSQLLRTAEGDACRPEFHDLPFRRPSGACCPGRAECIGAHDPMAARWVAEKLPRGVGAVRPLRDIMELFKEMSR